MDKKKIAKESHPEGKRWGDLNDEQKGKHQKLRMGCHRRTTAAPTLLARNCDTGLHFRIEVGRQAMREDEQEDIITSPWAAMATDGLAKPNATTAIEQGREETATNFQEWCEGGDFLCGGSQFTPRTSVFRLPNSLEKFVSFRAIFVWNELGTREGWWDVKSCRNHTLNWTKWKNIQKLAVAWTARGTQWCGAGHACQLLEQSQWAKGYV